MSKEKGCKWFFGPEGGADNGPTNPSKGTFRSQPDINIVREAIQNSLDVPLDNTKPVIVKFSFSGLSSSDFPNFFGIREHIVESLKFYEHTDRAKEKFPDMISYLSKDGKIENKEYAGSIGVLTISDFNTQGMNYVRDDRKCSFYAFFHSVGVSVCKGEGSGGSNGLGKETLYNRSVIKTLLLSTKNKNGDVVFQGAAKLTTHHDPETHKKVTAFGYYGQDDSEPVIQEANIPDCFKRAEVGTDIHIVGVDLSNPDAVRNSIIQAVLNHFWLAVHREKLIVEVDDVKIDKSSLCGLINKYFADNRETQTADYGKWNPRPYYNAVVNVDSKKEHTAFEEIELPTIAHCWLYLDWSLGDLPKRVAFMRQPRMIIFKKKYTTYPSFVGIFVCDNDIGNRILRCVEPPAHDEWDVQNYEGSDKDKHKKGREEVFRFVKEMLDKHLKPQATHNEIIIPGLAELLPDADEKTSGGERGTVGSGASEGLQPSDDISQEETAAPVSFIPDGSGKVNTPSNIPAHRGTVNGLVEDTTTATDDSGTPREIIGVPTNDADGGSSGGDSDSSQNNSSNTAAKNQAGAKIHVRLRVLMKAMFFKKDGELWHKIIVRPDPNFKITEYANVKLTFTTGSDNNSPDSTEIKKLVGLPNGVSYDGKYISGLDMRNGAKFDVLFADSIMHSVKVVAYASK